MRAEQEIDPHFDHLDVVLDGDGVSRKDKRSRRYGRGPIAQADVIVLGLHGDIGPHARGTKGTGSGTAERLAGGESAKRDRGKD